MTAPDLTMYRTIHTCLRQAAHRLAEAARDLDPTDGPRVRAFARYWEGYAGEVLAHHTIEDDFFFPALVAKDPVAGQLIARTDADHHHLDELMADCTANAGELTFGRLSDTFVTRFEELAQHMDEHLAFEDAEILPRFEALFDAEEYEELDQRAVKSLGLGKQAAFTIPFVGNALSDEERVRVLGAAPLPFRVLYRLTRRSHARLTDLALGGPVIRVPEAV